MSSCRGLKLCLVALLSLPSLESQVIILWRTQVNSDWEVRSLPSLALLWPFLLCWQSTSSFLQTHFCLCKLLGLRVFSCLKSSITQNTGSPLILGLDDHFWNDPRSPSDSGEMTQGQSLASDWADGGKARPLFDLSISAWPSWWGKQCASVPKQAWKTLL